MQTPVNLKYNKSYKYSQLKEMFGIYNKSGEDTIKEISKYYVINKVKRGVYRIERPLSNIEQIETQIYSKNKSYLEPIIYTMLLTINSNSITMDMHEIMAEAQVTNKDFHYIKYHTKECSDIMGIEGDVGLSIFTKEAEPMLKRIIRDILHDMEDRQLIKINEIPTLGYIIHTQEGQIITKTKSLNSNKEIQKLLEVKRTILQEHFNIDKESDLGYYEHSEFRDLIAKEYGASYYYYRYNLILNKIGLTEYENYDIIDLKKSFNKHIQEKIKKSKQGDLKILSNEEKDIYVKYCIDTQQDYQLRYKHKIQI